MAQSPRLFVVDDPIFDEHRARGYHPERPERLAAARRALERCADAGIELAPITPRDATDDEIVRAHAPAHLETLERARGKHAALDPDTYVAPGSVAAARRAAGSAIALVEALLTDTPGREARVGCALLRPPGHHATADHAMGFCLLNNAAIAARAAIARGAERVAIVDWDVHHGNGTQDIFWTDPRVLYVSLHQWPFYPGTGAAEETGAAEGAGYTINVPLSAGANDAVYEAAFHEIVIPALGQFEPELILVSAGFDAHERDPLASMQLTEAAYARMAGSLLRVARATAGGRLALLLEGGYDLAALEGSLAVSLCAAVESRSVTTEMDTAATPVLHAMHRDELTRARSIAARTWKDV